MVNAQEQMNIPPQNAEQLIASVMVKAGLDPENVKHQEMTMTALKEAHPIVMEGNENALKMKMDQLGLDFDKHQSQIAVKANQQEAISSRMQSADKETERLYQKGSRRALVQMGFSLAASVAAVVGVNKLIEAKRPEMGGIVKTIARVAGAFAGASAASAATSPFLTTPIQNQANKIHDESERLIPELQTAVEGKMMATLERDQDLIVAILKDAQKKDNVAAKAAEVTSAPQNINVVENKTLRDELTVKADESHLAPVNSEAKTHSVTDKILANKPSESAVERAAQSQYEALSAGRGV